MYQKLIIVGNLGRDPEMRYMPDGTAVTNFSVATSRKWTDQFGQKAEETTWFRVSTWGKQAETCHEYLTKGSKVLVEGRLQVDPTTGGPKLFTRQDGTVGAAFQVTASEIRFLVSKSDAAEDGYRGGSSYSSSDAVENDGIPF